MKKFVIIIALAFAFFNASAGTPMRVEVIEHKNSVVAVHFEVPSSNTKVKIRITHAKTHEVMYAETTAHHTMGIKKYDLSHLPAGVYSVEVITSEETVTRIVEVK